ncbi:dihydrofolate reductase family protein [Enterococcus casseliflavus]|uniref:dihydrofolate reductase family protein n=1 Tax=Enterococcus casseliflavus TaxID=37734 RepID=UPI0018845F47|nr:dihydrofolate reductase family protein [Enterococcus casseliflavus]MBE9907269.1 dihydrofolate reductase [Enterococcus casseliflavus]
MGKVIFYGAISLDGYLAGLEDQLDWLFQTDTGVATTYEAFFATIDTTVMGRKTYQEAKKLMDEGPLYPETKNYVFSHTRKEPLPDAILVASDPVAFVSALKQEKNVWIVGGGSLLKPLLEADLIDEWFIQVAPVLLGDGKRLFEAGDYARRLTFVETKQMGELTELHYVRKAEQVSK